jgi:excisionase family DNA binding protein
VEIKIRTDDVLSINQAAEQLGIDRATVYRWIAKGNLVSVRFGDVQYIPKSEVERLKKESRPEESET